MNSTSTPQAKNELTFKADKFLLILSVVLFIAGLFLWLDANYQWSQAYALVKDCVESPVGIIKVKP